MIVIKVNINIPVIILYNVLIITCPIDVIDRVDVNENTEDIQVSKGPFGLDFKDPQSYLTVLLSGLIIYNVLDTIFILVKRATSG